MRPGAVYAYWWFINHKDPNAYASINKAILKNPSLKKKFPHGFVRPPCCVRRANRDVPQWGGDVENEHEFKCMSVAEMNYLARKCPSACFVLHQKHGDIVIVPPGYPHQVWNVLPCIKVARDGLVTAHLPTVVRMQQLHGASLFAQRSPEDYSNAVGLAMDVVAAFGLDMV